MAREPPPARIPPPNPQVSTPKRGEAGRALHIYFAVFTTFRLKVFISFYDFLQIRPKGGGAGERARVIFPCLLSRANYVYAALLKTFYCQHGMGRANLYVSYRFAGSHV